MNLGPLIPATIRILLVDEDRSSHDLLCAMVETFDWNATLETIEDHAAALVGIAEARHDVYLIAFDPENAKPGDELLAAVRMRAPDAASIAIVASRPAGTPADADDFLPKDGLSDLLVERTIRYTLERRRASLAMRTCDELLRTVVSTAPIVLGAFDRNGILMFVDGRTFSTTGRSVESQLGESLLDVYRDKPELTDAVRGALRGESTSVVTELSGRLLECRCSPTFAPDGTVTGGVGIAIDVTEKARSEEAMRRSEEYLRLLAENTLDVVVTLDRKGAITYASPSTERALGYHPSEWIGCSFLDPIHSEDRERVEEAFDDLLATPQATARVEFRCRHRDGTWRDVETIARNLLHDPIVAGVVASTRDITDRRAALDALRRSQELFGSFMENCPAIAFIKNGNGRYLYINSRLTGFLDRSVEEIMGSTDDALFPPEIVAQWQEQDRLILDDQRTRVFEETFGQQHWMTVKFPVQGDSGQLLVGGLAFDVTERHAAEEALRLSEERFQLVAMATRDAIWDWNVSTGELWLSPNVATMFGYPAERMTDGFDWWYSRLHPDDRRRMDTELQKILAERWPVWIDEYRFLRGDGTYAAVLDRAHAVYDADGNIVRMIGAMNDVTDRKKADQALRDSEAKYRKIVETTREGVWVADAQDITTFVNARMTEILGYSAGEMIGRSYAEFMDAVTAEVAHIKSGERRRGIAEQYDLKFRRKDGSTVWAIVSANPILDDYGRYAGSLALITDITDRKHAERALQEANDQLERRVQERTAELMAAMQQLETAHRLQKQFVADASHHLRTPLTVIHAELELLLLRDVIPLPQPVVDALRRIDSESMRLRNLANDLLLLARLDVDALPEMLRPIRLDELLLDCITKLAPLARGKSIAWDIEIEDPIELAADTSSLEHAITNVLENGIKYSEEQGVIRVAMQAAGDSARIVIGNHGSAIAEKDAPHLFDRFYRGSASTSLPGTGLGLSIVKTVIERHGGSVDVTSDPEDGTVFTIMLPLAGDHAGPASGREASRSSIERN